MYVCLAVTCHLHFWQNDRDLLRATVVTQEWNGYQNKSQHRKWTLETQTLPPLMLGFKPVTFQSWVWCANHCGIPLLAMEFELHPWRDELEFFPSQLPFGHPYKHVFEPKLNEAVCDLWIIFSKCFQQSMWWCFGSHFFMTRSHRFIATCHCCFLASFLKGKAWKQNSFVNFSQQPTAAHSLSML